MAVGRLPKQVEVLHHPEVLVEAPPVVVNTQSINAMEEKAAADLAAHVAEVQATEAAALAKSAEEFPEYHADK